MNFLPVVLRIKYIDAKNRLCTFNSSLCHIRAIWSWSRFLTSLCYLFMDHFICFQLEIRKDPTKQALVKIKYFLGEIDR